MNVNRGICCHVGGHIDFDNQGNLYLSTGDDTNPFESDGFDPIDERPNRNPAFDAQRSAANTNDLRGKVLRIHVQDNGSYTIPPGNLFSPGTAKTRPEIYLMGLRNPFRIAVNRQNNDLYVADYSPDFQTTRTRCAGRRAPANGSSPAGPATTAGPTARPTSSRTSTTTSHRRVGRGVRLRASGQRLAAQHGAARAAAGQAPGRLVLVRAVAEFPQLGTGRRRPDGRSGVSLRPEAAVADEVAGSTTTASRCSTSGRATTSRSSA